MTSAKLFARVGALGVILAGLAMSACSSTATSTSNPAAQPAAKPASQPAQAPAPRLSEAERAKQRATRTGEIYLMRGLMDVFSRGIDVMAAQMRREGLYAVNTSYTEWEAIGHDIVRREKQGKVSHPIVIVGHSLGANDATKLARFLGDRGIKVGYVVTFDPTEPGYVGKNIGRVVNFYLPNENNKVYQRSGFRGTLRNVDLSDREDITHTTIEKDPRLQAAVISRIMTMTRRKRG